MANSGDLMQQAETVQFICNAINDGYSGFVLTHTIEDEVTAKDACCFDTSSLKIADKFKDYTPESLPTYQEFNISASVDKVQLYTRLHINLHTQKQAH